MIAEVLQRALAEGRLVEEAPAALFFDLDAFEERLQALRAAFPGAVHTLAVKAMPIPGVLRIALAQGFGLEVASEGELAIAEALEAFPVVFDSPAKTRAEIARAQGLGYRLNADSWQELERIHGGSVGLRVNPEVTGSTIAGSFTGGPGSKFGVPLSDRAAILAAFDRHGFLDGLHVHVGSQGCALDVLVEGVARVVELAEELLRRGRAPTILDIGGGLPARYRPDDRAPTYAEYAGALRARCPALFEGPWTVVTEMGRSLLAPCAFVASRVEYTKGRIAVVHVGADLFVRAALLPEIWHHEVEAYDAAGRPKTGGCSTWSIAGPLCFSADFVARDRALPDVVPGDLIVVRSTGAYTIAMWSRYNSRLCPEVVGYRREGALVTLKPRETPSDILRFWGFP